MTEKEKMLAGEIYDCGDPELLELWYLGKNLARDYNLADANNIEDKKKILKQLLGGFGKIYGLLHHFMLIMVVIFILVIIVRSI